MDEEEALFVSRAATVTNNLVRIGRTTYDVSYVRGVYIEEGSRVLSFYGVLLFCFLLFLDILAITTPRIGINVVTLGLAGWIIWILCRNTINVFNPKKFLVIFTAQGNSHAISSRHMEELSPLKHAIEMAISSHASKE